MTSLWPRLEPLLAKVQKPARYIGGEDGALTPDHSPGKVAWLLVYPDAYEIGLPNQGLQILYEILNERDDAVAERSYAPWVISAYSLVFGGFLLLGGRLADILGRRGVFMAGLVVFSVGSLLCGLAWSDTALIASRALQGLGAATITP